MTYRIIQTSQGTKIETKILSPVEALQQQYAALLRGHELAVTALNKAQQQTFETEKLVWEINDAIDEYVRALRLLGAEV